MPKYSHIDPSDACRSSVSIAVVVFSCYLKLGDSSTIAGCSDGVVVCLMEVKTSAIQASVVRIVPPSAGLGDVLNR